MTYLKRHFFIYHLIMLTALFLSVTSASYVHAADFNGFDRGSGYLPIDPAVYPEFEDLFTDPRPVSAFAAFDEKLAAYRAATPPELVMRDEDDIFVSLEEYTAGSSHFFLTHILIRNMDQIRIAQANDTFGGERELPTDYAARSGAAVVVNGSYFYYETNKPIDICTPVVLNDGNIYRDGTSNGSELCLRFDGSFFSPHPAMPFTAENLLALGVISNFGTADPLLIQDKTPMSFPNGVRDFVYPRTAVGVVEPGEYYLITAGSEGYSGGLSYRQMQALFCKLECSFARSLDGGGSVSLVINGELINSPPEGAQRPVVDFLVFDP